MKRIFLFVCLFANCLDIVIDGKEISENVLAVDADGKEISKNVLTVSYDEKKCVVSFDFLDNKEISITVAEGVELSELVFWQYSLSNCVSLTFDHSNSNSNIVLWFLKNTNICNICINNFSLCFSEFKSVYGVVDIHDDDMSKELCFNSDMIFCDDDEIPTYKGDEVVKGYLLVNDSVLIDNEQEGYSADSGI